MRRRTENYTPKYTYSEWLHWEERGELIQGLPVAKSTRIGPKHEKAVAAFKTALNTAFESANIKDCKVGEPIDYKISNDTILKPDVFVVCSKINKLYLDFPPVLVVEVISKATEERDRGVKFEAYEKHGVKYYIIADAMQKTIEIYQLVEGKFRLENFENNYELQIGNNSAVSLQLAGIF
jgi:Uma2 family endonuclease